MDNDLPNSQFVGIRGDDVVVLTPKTDMSKHEALVHAAWLVTLADPLGDIFPVVLAAVQNS